MASGLAPQVGYTLATILTMREPLAWVYRRLCRNLRQVLVACSVTRTPSIEDNTAGLLSNQEFLFDTHNRTFFGYPIDLGFINKG